MDIQKITVPEGVCQYFERKTDSSFLILYNCSPLEQYIFAENARREQFCREFGIMVKGGIPKIILVNDVPTEALTFETLRVIS